MKSFVIIAGVIFSLISFDVKAEEITPISETETSEKTITLNPIQIINLAKEFIKEQKYDNAKTLLLKSPFNIKELEIERLYLLSEIATLENRMDDAIEILRFILDYQPNISSIRFKLAQLYMLQKSWYRADYHLRLAATDENLPPLVKQEIAKSIYIARQNKNWNIWFNIGAAPDDNINNATGGEQCIMTMFGVLCNQLSEKEKAIGFNVSLGGNYEFLIGDKWRLRNEAMLYSNTYNKKEYDDLYLSYTFGPKYVWRNGEVFAGPSAYRRWLSHQPYSYAVGLKINTNYDFTRNLSGGLSLSYMPTRYDDYGEVLDGDTRGINARLSYMFDASKYFIFRTGYEIENTKERIYSNSKNSYAIGFCAEFPWGFSVYIEPSILYTNYDEERWFVKNLGFEEIKEKDITKRYSISLSNRKISLWGFTPTISYTYTDKNSNVWQHEYEKSAFEFTINQRF